MNTVKIALCYSGLVNTWEHLNDHYKFTKLFPSADNFDISVFIPVSYTHLTLPTILLV